jgi:cytochrome c553
VQSAMNRIVLLLLCLTLGTTIGCGGAPISEDAEERTRAEPAGEYMRDHFEQVRGVQVGVIRGDLAAVRAAAKWVATREALEGMPPDWEPYVAQMRSAAEDAVAAPDIATAAVATATMGSTCAACHEAMQGHPQFLAVAEPPESDETVPHMIGHMWAADRMWKGLVTPSAVSWDNGVAALAGDPLDQESIVSAADDPATLAALAALAAKVHDLPAQGSGVAEMDARVEIYGQFLATCAECHQLLGIPGEQ